MLTRYMTHIRLCMCTDVFSQVAMAFDGGHLDFPANDHPAAGHPVAAAAARAFVLNGSLAVLDTPLGQCRYWWDRPNNFAS